MYTSCLSSKINRFLFFFPSLQVKKVTENILSVVDTLGTTVLSTTMTGQKMKSLKSDFITMTLQRQAPSDIGSETFTGNEREGSVTFPSPDVLFGRNGTTLPSVDTEVSWLNCLTVLPLPMSVLSFRYFSFRYVDQTDVLLVEKMLNF